MFAPHIALTSLLFPSYKSHFVSTLLLILISSHNSQKSVNAAWKLEENMSSLDIYAQCQCIRRNIVSQLMFHNGTNLIWD